MCRPWDRRGEYPSDAVPAARRGHTSVREMAHEGKTMADQGHTKGTQRGHTRGHSKARQGQISGTPEAHQRERSGTPGAKKWHEGALGSPKAPKALKAVNAHLVVSDTSTKSSCLESATPLAKYKLLSSVSVVRESGL